MHLPIQSEPVQRTTIGQPGPANAVERTTDRSSVGEQGIQPSGWFDDIVKVATTVGPPLLGALGV